MPMPRDKRGCRSDDSPDLRWSFLDQSRTCQDLRSDSSQKEGDGLPNLRRRDPGRLCNYPSLWLWRGIKGEGRPCVAPLARTTTPIGLDLTRR
jgi:hypothetical protein